jgi:hypothetical protein
MNARDDKPNYQEALFKGVGEGVYGRFGAAITR